MSKVKYKCDACNWRFSSNSTPEQCPYCSKRGLSVYESEEAQSIIDEVTDLERQINQKPE